MYLALRFHKSNEYYFDQVDRLVIYFLLLKYTSIQKNTFLTTTTTTTKKQNEFLTSIDAP